ncbi:uncharacterized protein EI97DRAFT_375538 [Westerdykella ornata]|uniref:Homeobox and C2H2 transcription factor n=1 Tax=Westerdykella ornata TaxID=318751 RepID=A0A6A6JMN1_WESOR|nr:uncharacterized protein EI97DRAFT_375538 [Westerdykella ornata]KAF2277198.1 hypothetical protein EI97DRAFT_375538 [Westerdykella ornata]
MLLTAASCSCNKDIHVVADGLQPAREEPEFDYNFSNWLPRYTKPVHPCEYCRSRGLECFLYNAQTGKPTSCSPCNALFRPCSFSDPDKLPMLRNRTALDTLNVVTEDAAQCFGGRTGKKPLRSLGYMGPIIVGDLLADDAPKRGTGASRFPREAVKILKDWMIAHIDHPYPTEEEKEALKVQTGLSIGQISNWMANTRRRQKARPKRAASPSIRPSTEAVNIPPGRTWDDMNPLERWKHSPPENEPAPLTAIAKAMQTFDPPAPTDPSTSYNGAKKHSNGSTGSFSVFRAPSSTSGETSFTNMSSGSLGSAFSHGSRNSLGSLNSLKSKERRRRRRMPPRTPKLDLDSEKRLFQCTFCTDRFKNKYDWSRHEKSLHLSLVKWICAPLGDVITCTSSGQRQCVYCDAIDPTDEHLAAHNHRACEEKGIEARTFYRKDHLSQHLRLMHGCKMIPSMDSWKAEVQNIRSRCGFCNTFFDKWQDRVDHLAKEFRNGATMKDWKGCRGLEPHIAAQVTNAMPPYLIANESKSPFPFSATNATSMKHSCLNLDQTDLEYLLPTASNSPTHPADHTSHSNSSHTPTTAANASPQNSQQSPSGDSSDQNENPNPNATCWEVLTLRLGQMARQYIETHGPNSLTDEMLQTHARRILYDCDDPWNQTAADNPEWLGLFKKAHGIITPTDDRQHNHSLSHHEILEDLGVGPGAKLDKSFDLSNFHCVIEGQHSGMETETLAYECTLSGSMKISQTAREWKRNSQSSLTNQTVPGMSSASSGPSPSTSVSASASHPHEYIGLQQTPIMELMCSTPGGPCFGENGEIGFSARQLGKGPGKQAYFLDHLGDPPPAQTLHSGQTAPAPAAESGHPDLLDWSQFSTAASVAVPASLPTSTAAGQFGLSSSMPALGMGTAMASGFLTGAEEGVGNMPSMQWDDADLTFPLDMDMDLDFDGLDVDALLGGSS